MTGLPVGDACDYRAVIDAKRQHMHIVVVNQSSPSNYFDDVARLHEKELQAGLLAKLGTPFLADFYRYFANDPDCILLAVADDEHLKGFVSGTCDMKRFYRRYVVKRGFKLTVALTSYVLRSRSWPSVRTFVRYLSSNDGTDLPAAELTSLAVDSGAKRHGIGKELFAALRVHFHERGVTAFKVTAATTQHAALAFYPSVGGKIAARTRLGELDSITFLCSVGITHPPGGSEQALRQARQDEPDA